MNLWHGSMWIWPKSSPSSHDVKTWINEFWKSPFYLENSDTFFYFFFKILFTNWSISKHPENMVCQEFGIPLQRIQSTLGALWPVKIKSWPGELPYIGCLVFVHNHNYYNCIDMKVLVRAFNSQREILQSSHLSYQFRLYAGSAIINNGSRTTTTGPTLQAMVF